jgi:hypothetical protein
VGTFRAPVFLNKAFLSGFLILRRASKFFLWCGPKLFALVFPFPMSTSSQIIIEGKNKKIAVIIHGTQAGSTVILQ